LPEYRRTVSEGPTEVIATIGEPGGREKKNTIRLSPRLGSVPAKL